MFYILDNIATLLVFPLAWITLDLFLNIAVNKSCVVVGDFCSHK